MITSKQSNHDSIDRYYSFKSSTLYIQLLQKSCHTQILSYPTKHKQKKKSKDKNNPEL